MEGKQEKVESGKEDTLIDPGHKISLYRQSQETFIKCALIYIYFRNWLFLKILFTSRDLVTSNQGKSKFNSQRG